MDCGIVMPRALAVLRLMTSSNCVGCSMGSSAVPERRHDLTRVLRGRAPEKPHHRDTGWLGGGGEGHREEAQGEGKDACQDRPIPQTAIRIPQNFH